MGTMLLHAKSLQFEHPITNESMDLKAGLQSEFKRMLETLEF